METSKICDPATQRAIDFQRILTPDLPSCKIYRRTAQRLRQVADSASSHPDAQEAVAQLRDIVVRVGALAIIVERQNPSGQTRTYESL